MYKKISFICLCYFLSIISIEAAEITISAGDAGTSRTGNWSSATGASMPYNGNRGVYTRAGGEVETYTFATTIPETTQYTVQVFNSCYTPRSHQVIHRINHADGTDTHMIEQDCLIDPFVGQWRTLGLYNFTAGATGSVTIDTTNSDNTYIGATAVRFVYNATASPNTLPTITTTSSQLTVSEGDLIQLTASAQDVEDGDLTTSLQWSSLGQNGNGGSFSIIASSNNFSIDISVTDFSGARVTETINVLIQADQPPQNTNTPVTYDFECTTPLQPLVGFTTNNASALPDVGIRCGRYVAELFNNDNEKTLHYNNNQGRFDGVLLTFPFRVIARNVGVAPLNDPLAVHQYSGNAYNFVGLQVHHQDLNNLNSAHVVVGQRGGVNNTIEGKMTLNGNSTVGDIGNNALPSGRADLMIVGQADGHLLVYWQTPNLSGAPSNDNWFAYQDAELNPPGTLPGDLPLWESSGVYVGIITYSQGSNGIPFMGVIDSFEVSDF